MANKVLLGVLVAIVGVSVGVGVLIGMQLGGADGSPTAVTDGGETESTPTPIPDDTSEQQTATPRDRQEIPPEEFDAAEIRAETGRLVNERRTDDGLEPLGTDGQTSERLVTMADGHSADMAAAGSVGHNVSGTDSAARYRDAGLYDTCQFQSAEGTFVVNAENNDLEAIGRTVAGRTYSEAGEQRFNEDETDVAEAIVRQWYGTPAFREHLSYENAERLGIGVEITDDGTVYATANVC